ncbi:flagellar L-ring protein [Thermodesulfobium narugense DSM 14796]|uniref:Flagellar L-ring protein n=2 Tax=Thermodesulfobium narugense TaxID=184064 RepID=M1E7K8_9BACT|nr:flagellar L-ring protein [Thermodesulfobium narugense DSM 14796]
MVKMKKILLALFLFICMGYVSYASDVFKSDPSYVNLYSDVKAHSVGDTVMVLLSENLNSSTSTSTKKQGSYSNSNSATQVPFVKNPLKTNMSASGSGQYSDQGSNGRSATITGDIEARIVEVLPSGLLRIEGQKNIQVNKEKQSIIISGLIRPEDISNNNTIYSYQISDAQITIKGTSPTGAKGILGAIGNFFGNVIGIVFP